MFDFLKKILSKPHSKIIDSERNLLAGRISRFCYDIDLIDILYTPESKIYLLNTYTKNFTQLTELISSSNTNRELYSVNGYSYFNNTRMSIVKGFKHILKVLLSEDKICPIVFYDLNEVIDTLEYLADFKEKRHG